MFCLQTNEKETVKSFPTHCRHLNATANIRKLFTSLNNRKIRDHRIPSMSETKWCKRWTDRKTFPETRANKKIKDGNSYLKISVLKFKERE